MKERKHDILPQINLMEWINGVPFLSSLSVRYSLVADAVKTWRTKSVLSIHRTERERMREQRKEWVKHCVCVWGILYLKPVNMFTARWQYKQAKHIYYKKKVHRQYNIYCSDYRYLLFLFSLSLSASILPSILSATILITYSSPSFLSLSWCGSSQHEDGLWFCLCLSRIHKSHQATLSMVASVSVSHSQITEDVFAALSWACVLFYDLKTQTDTFMAESSRCLAWCDFFGGDRITDLIEEKPRTMKCEQKTILSQLRQVREEMAV